MTMTFASGRFAAGRTEDGRTVIPVSVAGTFTAPDGTSILFEDASAGHRHQDTTSCTFDYRTSEPDGSSYRIAGRANVILR